MRQIGKGDKPIKRGKDSWRIGVSYIDDLGNPQRERRTVHCKTITEARMRTEELRLEILQAQHIVEKSSVTLEQFLEEHLRYLHDVKHRSPSTLRGYRDIVKTRWVPSMGSMRLADVNPASIEKQLGWMRTHGGEHGEPLSGSTCQKAFSFLKTALKRAVRLGYIPANPCDMVDPPSKEKAKIAVIDENEVKRMKELLKGHPDYRFCTAVNLALDTGMRRGELCGLLWADVDLNSSSIHVRRALVEASANETYNGETLQDKDPKSETSDRLISLPGPTVELLRRHAETQYYRLAYYGVEQTQDTPVLCGNLGEDYRPSKFTSDFIAFSRQHCFDITLHGLRHAHASLLLKAGVPIQYVSQRLGHENVAVTYRFYAHFLPGDDGGSAKTWERVISDEGTARTLPSVA